MRILLRLLARLPLSTLHRIGAAIGWIVYIASPVYATRMRENLAASALFRKGAEFERALRTCVAETGRGAVEIAKVWFGQAAEIERLVHCDSWEVIEEARALGRGIVLLTPHLGCFEIAAFYIAQRMPLTVLYRPPRLRWLEPLMIEGRRRGQAQVAPANLGGVRLLFRALRNGDAIGLLPDQAPQVGEGVWAQFFGRAAYTMTLVRRLQKQTGAAVILVFAERLPHGRGFVLHLERFAGDAIDEQSMNRSVERLIRERPTQYLWSYNRYKVPAGVEPPRAASA